MKRDTSGTTLWALRLQQQEDVQGDHACSAGYSIKLPLSIDNMALSCITWRHLINFCKAGRCGTLHSPPSLSLQSSRLLSSFLCRCSVPSNFPNLSFLKPPSLSLSLHSASAATTSGVPSKRGGFAAGSGGGCGAAPEGLMLPSAVAKGLVLPRNRYNHLRRLLWGRVGHILLWF